MATIQERFRSVSSQVEDEDLEGLERMFKLLIEILEHGTAAGEKVEDRNDELRFAFCQALWAMHDEISERSPDDEEEEEEEEDPDEEEAAHEEP